MNAVKELQRKHLNQKKSKNNGSGHDKKEREQSPTEQKLEVNTDIVDKAYRSDTTLKTLLTGDSILSGINRRGLNTNTNITTLPGRKIRDIRLALDSWGMKKYENVIIYIDGNDMAEGSNCYMNLMDITALYTCAQLSQDEMQM
ncbi:hypothetical protein DPMN_035532 [Dreissena polymorpha]|uniref:Uncharacterized protein n=1 Tax=Dreissena polymorpha TaxID=45954 RepID=A0A9D4M7G6_DREPO|nr:hypothetical protein DPMN_035532 [Dreissena polymorpha]